MGSSDKKSTRPAQGRRRGGNSAGTSGPASAGTHNQAAARDSATKAPATAGGKLESSSSTAVQMARRPAQRGSPPHRSITSAATAIYQYETVSGTRDSVSSLSTISYGLETWLRQEMVDEPFNDIGGVVLGLEGGEDLSGYAAYYGRGGETS